MKKALLVLAIGGALLYSCKVAQTKVCPQKETVKESLSKMINGDFKVEDVQPMEGMEGLCEVVVKVGLRPIVLYTDAKAKNFIVGNVFNVDTKENLTQKTASKFIKVSEDVLDKLEKHVNMTYGEGDRFVYYITDPDCPFCKRFSPMLKSWADKNNVKVKVVLYPLPIHPEAKPKAVAMVCDKKGFDSLHEEVSTKNQCKEGKEAIEKNLQFLQEIGVSGTPTVIGMNGRYIVGLPGSEEELNALVR